MSCADEVFGKGTVGAEIPPLGDLATHPGPDLANRSTALVMTARHPSSNVGR
jgi:hypothetical protein